MDGQRVASIVVYVDHDGRFGAYIDVPRARQCKVGRTKTMQALFALVQTLLREQSAIDLAMRRVASAALEEKAARLVEGASLEQARWMLEKVRSLPDNDQSRARCIVESIG